MNNIIPITSDEIVENIDLPQKTNEQTGMDFQSVRTLDYSIKAMQAASDLRKNQETLSPLKREMLRKKIKKNVKKLGLV